MKYCSVVFPVTACFILNNIWVYATSTLKITLQNLQAANQDTYVFFVDIVKAFDSVNREMLWKILKKYGIPTETIAIIKKTYTDIKIKLGIEKAEALFYSTSGIKQGDNLALALFFFVIQATVETMHRKWSTMEQSEPQLYLVKEHCI